MGQLVDADQEHLRLLKIAYYITAGMVGVISLFSLIYIVLGMIMLSGLIPQSGSNQDPQMAGWVFLLMGSALLLLGLVASLLPFLTARFLERRQRRTFCMIVAALTCVQIPYGTAIGVCTFLVLSRESVKDLFARPAVPAPPPPVPAAVE